MEERERESDPQRTPREESALVRGWLRLADDVLKRPSPEQTAESDEPR